MTRCALIGAAIAPALYLLALPAVAQTPEAEGAETQEFVPYIITVNSNLDGPVLADGDLTLREAIELANGSLTLADLSDIERSLVSPAVDDAPQIRFNLPLEQTTIALNELLPALKTPGTVVDGGTQPGYGSADIPPAHVAFPVPIVTLTPGPGQEIFRGLTVAADRVVVRGLSLYGFRAAPRSTLTTPPSDIFISNAPPPADASPLSPPIEFFNLSGAAAVRNVVIENNWLGIPPSGEYPEPRSAFGVSVFNASDVILRQNRIEHHDGSAIITKAGAEGLTITENTILGNGVAGMPDAIRLEGNVSGAALTNNLLCGNDGSGVYLFKPEGSVSIQDNIIKFNGRRFQRSAVYLMGNDHQVTGNLIGYQPGPGVTVAAFPRSDRNIIRNNQFLELAGLSIDLNAQDSSSILAYQQADGPNPPRNSHHRRTDTGNGAINAPQFMAYEFPLAADEVTLQGSADPGSEVDIYQVVENAGLYSPLAEPLMTVVADETGQFSTTMALPAGTRISAIATDPRYGTSEPAPVTTVQTADGAIPDLTYSPISPPSCFAADPPLDPPPEPQPLQLRVPRNVHFALDQSNISPESARVLDQIVAVLLEYPFISIELEGHTDPRASVAYNQALSERRALSVRNYLLQQGIAPERMRIRPLGESQRIADGNSRVDYARDRRVEVIFEDTRGLEIIFERQESDLQLE
ncbi:MAG: OmpA family protein [Cyanobacteria bacterium P01_H01_bin.119]